MRYTKCGKTFVFFVFLSFFFFFFFLHMYIHLFHSHMLTNSPSSSCLCILVKIDGPCVPLSLVSPFWCTDVCVSPLAVPYCLDSHNFTKASESGTRNPPTVVFFFFFCQIVFTILVPLPSYVISKISLFVAFKKFLLAFL